MEGTAVLNQISETRLRLSEEEGRKEEEKKDEDEHVKSSEHTVRYKHIYNRVLYFSNTTSVEAPLLAVKFQEPGKQVYW